MAAAFSLTDACGGSGTALGRGGANVSSRAISASISARSLSRCMGRSRMRSLKGAAVASFTWAARWLTALAA